MKDLRLVSGYEVLYGKLKNFVKNELFDEIVDLESPNTLRNLAETVATKTTIETFKRAINELTFRTQGPHRSATPLDYRTHSLLSSKNSLICCRESLCSTRSW